jgi:hypothetical protein
VDFDFFSHVNLDMNKEQKLISALPFLETAQVTQSEENTRSYQTADNVKISFFGGISFGRVGIPLTTIDGILQVASLDDLLATKLAVLLKRVEPKDYIDIASMLRKGISLEKGLCAALALYGSQFPPSECIKTLTYFQGNKMSLVPQIDKNILLAAAKQIYGELTPRLLVSKKLTNETIKDNSNVIGGRPEAGHGSGISGEEVGRIAQRLSEMDSELEKLLCNMPGEQARIRKRKALMDGITRAADKEKAFTDALASLKSLTAGRGR